MLFILLIFSAIKLTDSWCRPTERADVVFIFEESYSMGEMVFPSEWDYQKSFLAKIVEQMYIDPNNGIRVGGVTYNNESTVRFYLDTYTTKSDIIDAILNIGTTRRESVYENDTDLVYKGLETAYDSVFLSSRGDRADAPNYYIYTTDYIFPDDDPYTTGLNIRFTGDSYIWALGVKSARYPVRSGPVSGFGREVLHGLQLPNPQHRRPRQGILGIIPRMSLNRPFCWNILLFFSSSSLL